MKIVLTDKQNGIDSTSGPLSSTSKTTPPSTASTTSTANSPKKPAPFQASKDQIMALQKILKDAKMYSGEANGERSDELKEAVKKYQEANGLKVTGGINAATLEKTGIALTDAQKAQIKSIREANKPDKANFDQLKAIREAHNNGTPITADQKAQLKVFRDQSQAKMKSVRDQIQNVLTADQKAQIETRRTEMKQHMEQFRENRPAKPAAPAAPIKPITN